MKKATKEAALKYALGIAQINGVKPSDEVIKLARMEIEGKITLEEMERIICEKYNIPMEEK